MNRDTRDRLIQAASRLFASHGYRGAPVRDICNLARANPGAVSYHFGGKRQLYRTVLRLAAERLATNSPSEQPEEPEQGLDLVTAHRKLFRRIHDDPVAAQLLLRDLADGGTVAVEALEPTLRAVLDELSRSAGHSDATRTSFEIQQLFLELAAPLFLLTAAWPVVSRPLELEEGDRTRLLDAMIQRVVAGSPYASGSTS